MSSKDRRKLQKKKARQERIRQEKHLRQSLPRYSPSNEADEYDEEVDEGFAPPIIAGGPGLGFTTERLFRDLRAAIDKAGIESEEELKAFTDRFMAQYNAGLRDVSPPSAKQQAQDLAYQAMEAFGGTAIRLAREALQLDADCVDARLLLANADARSPTELVALVRQAVEAGERSLGKEFFEENRGHFWGMIETRPYMRARAGLAGTLRELGRTAEAIAHYEALLELNPNDNQGNRDVLLGLYFEVDDLDGARRLLDRFPDGLAVFSWGRVLERFLAGDLEEASTARQQAHKDNRYVVDYLSEAKSLPKGPPDYYSPGQETEAIICAVYLGRAWQRHPDAVSWLRQWRKSAPRK